MLEEEEIKEESKDESDIDLEDDDLLEMLDEDDESSSIKLEDIETKKDESLEEDDELLFDIIDEEDMEDDTDDSKDKNNSIENIDDLDIIPISEEKDDEDIDLNRQRVSKKDNEDDILEILDESEIDEIDDKKSSKVELNEEDIVPLEEDNKVDKVDTEDSSIEYSQEQKDKERIESKKDVKLQNIIIDLDDRAKLLEIDRDEYQSLFMDFIADAREMRSELNSKDDDTIISTISILKDAVLLLQLDSLKNILEDIEATTDPKIRENMIDQFYLILDKLESELEAGKTRIEIINKEEEVSTDNVEVVKNRDVKVSNISEISTEEKKEENKTTQKRPKTNKLTEEEILKGVKPIPIDFSLHIASEELSLPEDLVLEFISDFAQQAHENLPILIEEYRNDELDKLQKTAHMLKGAASNLRIEQMVDNLYQLQYDNNIENAPERIRKFAGQLMGLDNYLKQMNVK